HHVSRVRTELVGEKNARALESHCATVWDAGIEGVVCTWYVPGIPGIPGTRTKYHILPGTYHNLHWPISRSFVPLDGIPFTTICRIAVGRAPICVEDRARRDSRT